MKRNESLLLDLSMWLCVLAALSPAIFSIVQLVLGALWGRMWALDFDVVAEGATGRGAFVRMAVNAVKGLYRGDLFFAVVRGWDGVRFADVAWAHAAVVGTTAAFATLSWFSWRQSQARLGRIFSQRWSIDRAERQRLDPPDR